MNHFGEKYYIFLLAQRVYLASFRQFPFLSFVWFGWMFIIRAVVLYFKKLVSIEQVSIHKLILKLLDEK